MAVRNDFDLLIVGGGNVGAALALAMGQQLPSDTAWRIGLVEPRPPENAEHEADVGLRVSALSPGSRHFLEHLDAWPQLDRRGPQAYTRMEVEDASGRGQLHFNAEEHALPALGWIVDNQHLRGSLWQQLAQTRVEILSGVEIRALQQRRRGLSVELNDGRELRVGLLAAADGARSAVRQLLEIPVTERDYQQQALVAVVETTQVNPGIAWQRYLPGGPLAFLPVTEGRSSIVWSLPDAQVAEYLAMDNESFCQALGGASDYRFGPIKTVGERAAFPLSLMLAQQYLVDRVVLLGDAAHRIHPQAGLGLNLGLQDAASLAELLGQVVADNAEILTDELALKRVLRRYERWRRSEDELVVRGVDRIGQLMRGDGTLAQVAGAGLSLVNRLTPLKAMFLRQACGIGGDAPAWFRHGPAITPESPGQ